MDRLPLNSFWAYIDWPAGLEPWPQDAMTWFGTAINAAQTIWTMGKLNCNRGSVLEAVENLGRAESVIAKVLGIAAKPDRQPLGKFSALVYEKLIELPEYKAMTGPAILDWLARKGHDVSEDRLNKEILPPLWPWGMKNKKKIGYYIPLSARPEKISTKIAIPPAIPRFVFSPAMYE